MRTLINDYLRPVYTAPQLTPPCTEAITPTMNDNDNTPSLPIREWLRSVGTSWTEIRRYAVKRTKVRRALREAIYRRQSAPLKCHEGTRHATLRSTRHR